METNTASRNKDPNINNGLGRGVHRPCKCLYTNKTPTTIDIHPNTIRYFKSALIIRRGMNPGANSLGAIFRWKSGGKIKSTESADRTVVVNTLLQKLFLSFSKLLKAFWSLYLVITFARIYFLSFSATKHTQPDQNIFSFPKYPFLNGFSISSILL